MTMKFLLPLLFLLLLISCNNGNGSKAQKQRADSLALEVVEQRLDIRDLANSDHFMYYEDSQAQNTTDIKKLTGIEKIKAKVVAYRIYKNLSLENNRYVFRAKSPLELHIPNKIFVSFERAFITSNNNVISSKDSIKLELPTNFQDSVLTW
ncbi:hypothetical protein EDF67_101341 [Sphingobacterium sp. JUb78]|nr:hypothetical protein EDF67_101341 [Sphingobacterium sp. JUb78]